MDLQLDDAPHILVPSDIGQEELDRAQDMLLACYSEAGYPPKIDRREPDPNRPHLNATFIFASSVPYDVRIKARRLVAETLGWKMSDEL
jgi:hypothetical protein